MSSLRSKSYSIDEYFGLERASERRFEYRNGEIVCMAGGSIEHAAITSNQVVHGRGFYPPCRARLLLKSTKKAMRSQSCSASAA